MPSFVLKQISQLFASIIVIASEADIPLYCVSVHHFVNNSRMVGFITLDGELLTLMSLLVGSILILGSCRETESLL